MTAELKSSSQIMPEKLSDEITQKHVEVLLDPPMKCVNDLQFIKSGKGGLKLIYKGYAYIKKRELKTSTNWECEMRRNKHQCKHQIWTFNRLVVKEALIEHTHPPDMALIDMYKINQKIKEDAIKSFGSPTGEILAKNLKAVSSECTKRMPNVANLKRRIRRIKQKHIEALLSSELLLKPESHSQPQFPMNSKRPSKFEVPPSSEVPNLKQEQIFVLPNLEEFETFEKDLLLGLLSA